MLETEKGIYCKKCKDYFPEDHFNKFKYNEVRGIPYTCKNNKRKGGKYESINKYEIDSYEYSRDMALRRMYGTSLEEFNKLLFNQNNCCKICNKEYTENKKFVIDHCHNTGKIRGILCNECNAAIGRLLDNSNLLKLAKEYLENPTTSIYPNCLKGYPQGKPKRIPDGSLDVVTARRRRRLWREYQMSLEDYNNLLELQNNCCAICNINQEKIIIKLCVDHNHETGSVRGLLCSNCNSGIGFLKDNPDLIFNAIKYLE